MPVALEHTSYLSFLIHAHILSHENFTVKASAVDIFLSETSSRSKDGLLSSDCSRAEGGLGAGGGSGNFLFS